MSDLFVENKQVVTPGTVLANGLDYLPGVGAYRNGEDLIANRVGLVSVNARAIRLIPVSGRYNPKVEDVIIGKVIDVAMSGWRVDTNTAYPAMLSVKEATEEYIEKNHDLTTIFSIGDYVISRIINVTSQKLIDLTMRNPGLQKLEGGQVIKVNAYKVPRVIGKQGSMVSMIKEATGCNIIVGQNGLVWVCGSPKGEVIAKETIKMIEKFAHVSGLTDLVKAHLAKETDGLDLPKAEPLPEAHPRRPRPQHSRGYDRDRGGRGRPGGNFRNNNRSGGRRFNNNRRGGSHE